uniref:Putative Erf family protein n=1 Tax=viral metagenome TaxID=1070528 RepID=A0A6M3LKQ7_9ZZZZ
MQSESIIEISKALNDFQAKVVVIKKDATNPFFRMKYATLDSIWSAIRKPLTESGLSVVQTLGILPETTSILETTLLHTSGEWIKGAMLLNPVKNDPQGLGAATTYARRYSLSAILGVVADEDDDANSASTPRDEKAKKAKGITNVQISTISTIIKEKGIKSEVGIKYIQETFKKTASKDLTLDEADQLIEYLAGIE